MKLGKPRILFVLNTLMREGALGLPLTVLLMIPAVSAPLDASRVIWLGTTLDPQTVISQFRRLAESKRCNPVEVYPNFKEPIVSTPSIE